MAEAESRACTFADVEKARSAVYRHLYPTPLHEYPALGELVGASVHVKHENHHAVGAFKVRGGVNLASRLSAAERQAGIPPSRWQWANVTGHETIKREITKRLRRNGLTNEGTDVVRIGPRRGPTDRSILD